MAGSESGFCGNFWWSGAPAFKKRPGRTPIVVSLLFTLHVYPAQLLALTSCLASYLVFKKLGFACLHFALVQFLQSKLRRDNNFRFGTRTNGEDCTLTARKMNDNQKLIYVLFTILSNFEFDGCSIYLVAVLSMFDLVTLHLMVVMAVVVSYLSWLVG